MAKFVSLMDWQRIVTKVRLIKENFDRSYKCLNIDRPTKDVTVAKHLKILFKSFEQIRVLLNVNYSRLAQHHKAAAESFFIDIKGKLYSILVRRGLNVKLPDSLHEELEYDIEGLCEDSSNLTERNTKNSLEILSSPEKMPQTPIEFLNIASKLIPEFDGRPECLQSFKAALILVDSVCDGNDTIAINLVKTKLKGNAINLLKGNETTLTQVAQSLAENVKGDSTDVIAAKLMNVRQSNKTANVYIKEVEELTKSLESAYITDGLTPTMAEKYSTKAAVKAITTNATNEKVKIIMQAGQFGTLNEAVEKFVSTCTEINGQHNSVLYYGNNANRGNYGYNANRGNNHRGSRGGGRRSSTYRGRGNYQNNGNRQNSNNNRGRGNNRRTHNVRLATDHDNGSENSNQPLSQ